MNDAQWQQSMAYQHEKDSPENLLKAVNMNGGFDWLDQAYAPGSGIPPASTPPASTGDPVVMPEYEDTLGSNYQEVDRGYWRGLFAPGQAGIRCWRRSGTLICRMILPSARRTITVLWRSIVAGKARKKHYTRTTPTNFVNPRKHKDFVSTRCLIIIAAYRLEPAKDDLP